MKSLIVALSFLTIHFNPGGNVEKFANKIEHLDRPVRIEGICASACTMYLGAKDVCVSENSRFMFHMAYDEVNGRTYPSEEGTEEMAQFWPLRVRQYVIAKGVPAPPGELWLRGRDLIQLGVKDCNPKGN